MEPVWHSRGAGEGSAIRSCGARCRASDRSRSPVAAGRDRALWTVDIEWVLSLRGDQVRPIRCADLRYPGSSCRGAHPLMFVSSNSPCDIRESDRPGACSRFGQSEWITVTSVRLPFDDVGLVNGGCVQLAGYSSNVDRLGPSRPIACRSDAAPLLVASSAGGRSPQSEERMMSLPVPSAINQTRRRPRSRLCGRYLSASATPR